MIRRRELLGAALGLLLSPASAFARAGTPRRLALAPDIESALATSPTVYISPLRSDGEESTCHGEVWYGWLDGAVVINTQATTWKARSLGRGLDRARRLVALRSGLGDLRRGADGETDGRDAALCAAVV